LNEAGRGTACQRARDLANEILTALVLHEVLASLVRNEILASLVLNEILASLVLHVREIWAALMHRGSEPTHHRGGARRRHHRRTALHHVVDRDGLLVHTRMPAVSEMARELLEMARGIAVRSRTRTRSRGAYRDGLPLLLFVVIGRFVKNAVADHERISVGDTSAMNEDVLGVALLTDVAEATFLVPVLDDSNFGHFVDRKYLITKLLLLQTCYFCVVFR